jgi:hypothetical protein
MDIHEKQRKYFSKREPHFERITQLDANAFTQ